MKVITPYSNIVRRPEPIKTIRPHDQSVPSPLPQITIKSHSSIYDPIVKTNPANF